MLASVLHASALCLGRWYQCRLNAQCKDGHLLPQDGGVDAGREVVMQCGLVLAVTNPLVCRAGYLMTSVFNLVMILVLGLSSSEGAKITMPQQQSAYSNAPPQHTTPTYPPRG